VEDSADLTDAQLWLALSEHKLRMAREHLAGGEYRDAVSDAYYAMFHVARAALITSGVESRRHTGVISRFAELFVKTDKVDRELSRTLMRGLQLRADADYSPRVSLNREKATQAVAEAEAFVAQVRVFVERSDS
jgi:uncharacterized protein (UPF0332 family)